TRQVFRCMERLNGRWMDKRFEKSICCGVNRAPLKITERPDGVAVRPFCTLQRRTVYATSDTLLKPLVHPAPFQPFHTTELLTRNLPATQKP
ncbi:hypothetical protein, partial [Bilophila wadsworthia]